MKLSKSAISSEGDGPIEEGPCSNVESGAVVGMAAEVDSLSIPKTNASRNDACRLGVMLGRAMVPIMLDADVPRPATL